MTTHELAIDKPLACDCINEDDDLETIEQVEDSKEDETGDDAHGGYANLEVPGSSATR